MKISNNFKWGFLAIPISKDIMNRSAIGQFIAESVYANENDICRNLPNIRCVVDMHISDGKSVADILSLFLTKENSGAVNGANSSANKE